MRRLGNMCATRRKDLFVSEYYEINYNNSGSRKGGNRIFTIFSYEPRGIRESVCDGYQRLKGTQKCVGV